MTSTLLRGSAFITGAASGIGQATAMAFARYGVQRLALADVNIDALQAATNTLTATCPGVEILQLQLDVRESQAVKDCIAKTVEKFGRLDIAVNNAGISGSGNPTHEVPEEEWASIVSVDLAGVWRCQKEEIQVMLKQEDLGPREGRGRIINTASMFGIVSPGHTPNTAYSAAKHGVLGLTKGDANTYGPQNIRINAVCPGYVETPMLIGRRAIGPDSPLGKDVARTPLRRMAKIEEIADVIAFLASPMSSFVHGSAIVADGGFTAQ